MAASGTQRKKLLGHRRRIEDEADDDCGVDSPADLDDDSVTDGSIGSDDHDPVDGSDTSNVDDASPTSPNARKSLGNGNGAAKAGYRRNGNEDDVKTPPAETAQSPKPLIADSDTMMSQLTLGKKDDTEVLHFDDTEPKPKPPVKEAPVIVSSSAATQRHPQQELQRRKDEEYRRRREEDPTFVPNRGSFFLHDHRQLGPAANGFRRFPGGVRGRGRGTFGNHFASLNPVSGASDPIVTDPWKHDMHEMVADSLPQPSRQTRYPPATEGPPNGNGIIPTAPKPETPINRAMSTEKVIGTVTVRVFIAGMSEAKLFPGVTLKQYTKLPDHRPPLRRDKPVRISIPYHDPPIMPRYIFPHQDRSFIFIPRAMRPNQQRARAKAPRSVLGSGVFSRAASVFGGSIYGSVYSPSVALSRRSSIAPEIGREVMLSPTSSAISRPPHSMEGGRPVTHALPPKPIPQEARPNVPVQQPRPQKAVSAESIETSAQQASNAPSPYEQAFHQQVPPQLTTGGFSRDTHAQTASFQSQLAASSIPERAIHAAPFQPAGYAQPALYSQHTYATVQPQQGFYYPAPQTYTTNMPPSAATAPAFIPAAQQAATAAAQPPTNPADVPGGPPPPLPPPGPAPGPQNLVAQEINGMVYYYDPSQLPMPLPPPPQFAPAAPPGQGPPPGPYGAPYGAPPPVGMVPGPDGYYYQQGVPAVPPTGMVYYPQ